MVEGNDGYSEARRFFRPVRNTSVDQHELGPVIWSKGGTTRGVELPPGEVSEEDNSRKSMIIAVGMRLVHPADIDLQGRPAESATTWGGVKGFGEGSIDEGDQFLMVLSKFSKVGSAWSIRSAEAETRASGNGLPGIGRPLKFLDILRNPVVRVP